jgi:hypothetical protein
VAAWTSAIVSQSNSLSSGLTGWGPQVRQRQPKMRAGPRSAQKKVEPQLLHCDRLGGGVGPGVAGGQSTGMRHPGVSLSKVSSLGWNRSSVACVLAIAQVIWQHRCQKSRKPCDCSILLGAPGKCDGPLLLISQFRDQDRPGRGLSGFCLSTALIGRTRVCPGLLAARSQAAARKNRRVAIPVTGYDDALAGRLIEKGSGAGGRGIS